MARDAVDDVVDQWRRERPDLPMEAMATLGRLGEFDVLAGLRRAGPPYVAAPSRLTRMPMLSPAAMTNRLDRLETAGLVALTDAGFATVDAAVTDHVALEEELLGPLTAAQRRGLDDGLRALLASLEAGRG